MSEQQTVEVKTSKKKVTTLKSARKVDIGGFLGDICTGFTKVEIWSTFAWDEIRKRYRRSRLGISWILISHVLFIAAIALFFSDFSAADPYYFLIYVATGFTAFLFIVANLSDGCDVFTSSKTWMKSTSLPYSIYVYKSIARSLFVFLLNMLVTIIILLCVGWRPQESMWLIAPVFLLFIVNAVWIQYLFGILAAKVRDLQHLVNSLTRLLFFTTPILWVHDERMGTVALVADINPVTHFVEVFREPLIGGTVRTESWIFVGIFTVAGIIVTTIIGSLYRRRLPFWI